MIPPPNRVRFEPSLTKNIYIHYHTSLNLCGLEGHKYSLKKVTQTLFGKLSMQFASHLEEASVNILVGPLRQQLLNHDLWEQIWTRRKPGTCIMQLKTATIPCCQGLKESISHRGHIFGAVGHHINSKSRFPPRTGRFRGRSFIMLYNQY